MRALGYAVIVVALGLGSGFACADEAIPNHPALKDRFYFGIGAFMPKTSTSAELDSTTLGTGTNINFEQALGMETQKTVPEAFARWRVSERWRVEGEYFQLNRTGSRTINQDIQWGDQTFPVNTTVESKFDFTDMRVSGGYSFFKTTDKEVGVSLGFHVASYDASIGAAGVGSEAKKVTAPLPVLSGYGQFALTDTWAIGARLDRFSMSYDKYEGNITSMAVDINYQPFRYLGFGAGYRSLFIKLTATGSDLTGRFDQAFQGPIFYVTGSF